MLIPARFWRYYSIVAVARQSRHKSLKDARARLKEMPFDVLISDLNLPDGDGLDLVREAKQTHKLKAIAVTGRTAAEEQDQGLKAGVDYYLTKPIDYQQLKKALSSSPS